MQKMLITTALLAASAGMAAADVTFGGYGRFGVDYVETDGGGGQDTTISMRLRFNIDAKTETDAGVTFGGRIRLQYTDGDDSSFVGPAYVYAEAGALRLEVGNANSAYDSAALMYNSEIGFLERGAGDPGGSFYAFESSSYGGNDDRMGVFFAYSAGDFGVRISTITADQTGGGAEPEFSISGEYTFGSFTVSAAAARDGNGILDNDLYFVGGEYAINDSTNVGLLYFDNGELGGIDQGERVTLYGNTRFGATTVKAFVANDNADGNEEETAYGVGADYDLGGALLSGSVATNYDGNVEADLGVRFDF